MAGAGSSPRLEVVYRDPLMANARVVAGSFSAAEVPAGAVPVAVTTQTAARFGLHPGPRLELTDPSGPVVLAVTAIVAERDAGSTFWTQDITVGVPSFVTFGRYWVGGVFADPGALAAMQKTFGGPGLSTQWEFPLGLGGVNADQAQRLSDDLGRALAAVQEAGGGGEGLTVTSPAGQDLSAFLDTQAATQTVLLLLFVSMIVVGIAVILVASLTIAVRRGGELAVLRARGGSLRQVAGLLLQGTAVACVPAALAGAGLAPGGGAGDAGAGAERLVGAGLSAGRGRGAGRAGRTVADRGMAASSARPGGQPGVGHHGRDVPVPGGVAAPPGRGGDGVRGVGGRAGGAAR
jgi:putative ABC transport system permease protein